MKDLRITLLCLLACTALAGCGSSGSSSTGGAGLSQRSAADDALVARFCAYDSKTHSGIITCFERTSPFQVRGLKTNAARYAAGQGKCLADSGPFCR